MTGRRGRLTEATLTLKAGTWVSWRMGRGRARGKVVSVHKAGKVPGVPGTVAATAEAPAARIQVYAQSGTGWTNTSTHVGAPVDKLKEIDELPAPAATEAVVAATTVDDLRTVVRAGLLELEDTPEHYCWVVDMGVDWVVYSGDHDALVLRSFTYADGKVVFGEPVDVVRQTTYLADESDDDGMQATESVDSITGRLLAAGGTDAAGGRVYRVQLIAYGDSKNGRRYNESVMRAAVSKYEGAKAFDRHRTTAELQSSTITGLVGHYRNVTATDRALEADLHLLPSATHTAEALDQSLINQAAGLPALVGISHDVFANYRYVVAGGKKLTEATEILSVNSADVVADPAAGGQATRMVAGGPGDHTNHHPKEGTVNLQQLLALLRATEAANRATLLTEHAHLIEASGLTPADVLRLAEANPTPVPVASSAGDLVRGSTLAGMVIREAVKTAQLPERLAESIALELPEHFSEADVAAKVTAYQRIAEGFERAGLTPTVPATQVGEEARDKKIKAVDAMLAGNYREGYRSFREAYIDFTGRRPTSLGDDLNREILRESLVMRNAEGDRITFDSGMRQTESLETTSWAEVLGDSVTRRLIAEYSVQPLRDWEALISSRVPINDFRTQRIDRIGGYGTLPTVAQGAPYQALTSPGDEEVTYAIAKKGGTEDLTLEMIANDDLRAIQQIPVKLGRAAARTLHNFVWALVSPTGNPNIYDSTALYTSGHGNTTTTALSSTALEASRVKMRKQSAYGDSSEILSLVPMFLIVPPDLEALAFELCTSAVALPSGAPVGAASNIPNLHQGLKPIVKDHWSAESTTGWILVADPALAPTIELGYYQGKEDPELFVQTDPTVGSLFTSDKITWKIRHIYGGTVLDYRPFQRGNT